MKWPFVSRKKYLNLKENLKNINENRKKIADKCKNLQLQIKKLEKEIKELKSHKTEGKTYFLKICQKCHKYFTIEKGSRRKYCLDCKKKKKEN